MNEAQGAAATGEAEGTTPAVTGPETLGTTTKPEPGRLGALLADLGVPTDVIEHVAPKGEEKKEETQQPGESEEEPGEEQPAGEPAEEEGQPAEAPETPPAAVKEETVPEEWPASAKARVFEEARKKRDAKARVTELEGQLAAARGETGQQQQPPAAPAPTPEDPLADVVDGPSYLRAEAAAREALLFAVTHRDGATDVPVRNAKGEITNYDFMPEQVAEMEAKALDALLVGLPKKHALLTQASQYMQEAQKSYPEMFKEGTEENQKAAEYLSAFPEIRRDPKFLLRIGDAVYGERTREAKGKKPTGKDGKPLSDKAAAILNQPRVPLAPGVPNGRSPERRATGPAGNGVDAKEAREEFAARGFSQEALGDFVTKLRIAQGAGTGQQKKTLA